MTKDASKIFLVNKKANSEFNIRGKGEMLEKLKIAKVIVYILFE